LPETVREQYFLRIHGYAERAYEPRPYPAELVTFFGDRLYEDPTMGWDGLALGGVDAYAVPGEHSNNRQLMMEPNVGFVRDRLVEYLARSETVANGGGQ
jgi:hypothetical protein